MTDDIEQKLEDLEARFEALNRGRLTAFERLDELEEKVDSLMQTVDPNPERASYDQLTRDQKIHRIRTQLLKQAADTNGRASMNYREIKMLFDGNPSDGHAYDLMEAAGQMDGYESQTEPNRRVIVRQEDVNDTSLVHIVNNRTTENTA